MKAVVAAALAISIFTAVNAQSANDAPVRDAQAVKQLKKLVRATEDNTDQLRQVNATLGHTSQENFRPALDWLQEIEQNTKNICYGVRNYSYQCP